ncbi:hypothetical protein PoB_006562500 [Plakobranchus ocellatus]|uniref:Uncharacterized protein n=1 Tax=Plakobranchus ocellatus TaxID=259542 RepID=A0AAV4D541_9GAST|nr:hypothetical protein PoB_006562500 [Plakobranchus ocellatus]
MDLGGKGVLLLPGDWEPENLSRLFFPLAGAEGALLPPSLGSAVGFVLSWDLTALAKVRVEIVLWSSTFYGLAETYHHSQLCKEEWLVLPGTSDRSCCWLQGLLCSLRNGGQPNSHVRHDHPCHI